MTVCLSLLLMGVACRPASEAPDSHQSTPEGLRTAVALVETLAQMFSAGDPNASTVAEALGHTPELTSSNAWTVSTSLGHAVIVLAADSDPPVAIELSVTVTADEGVTLGDLIDRLGPARRFISTGEYGLATFHVQATPTDRVARVSAWTLLPSQDRVTPVVRLTIRGRK